MDYVTAIANAIRAELDPHDLPDERVEDLLRIYAVLALTLGSDVTASDVHDAWVAWMAGRDDDHPALVPFAELDARTAAEDAPFVKAIRRVVVERAIPGRRTRGSRG